jgi:WD40 repeat protein
MLSRLSALPGFPGRSCFRLALLLLGLAVVAAAALRGKDADLSSEAKARMVLQRLERRYRGEDADRDHFRRELLDFRLRHAGTATTVQAADLLRGLPSPLDRLDPKDVPPQERFPFQPRELVAVVGEHRQRHGSLVAAVAVRPDGRMVASGGTCMVRLWDPATMQLVGGVPYLGSVSSLAFSRDSKALVVGGNGGVLQVWDLVSGEPLPRLRFTIPTGAPILAVAFAPDSRTLAAGCFDHSLRLYDVGGKEVRPGPVLDAHHKPVSALAFSGDGKSLASGSDDGKVRLWSVAGTACTEGPILIGHEGFLTSLAFGPKGDVLASGSLDGTARVWSLSGAGPRERLVLDGKPAVNGVSFSHSGDTLATACGDGTVRLWNVTVPRPTERARLNGHAGAVRSVAYLPDDRSLVSGGRDWTVRLWDVSGPRPSERFAPWSHLSQVSTVAFSPDSRTLLTGSLDETVRLWDLTRAPLRTRTVLRGDPGPIWCLACSSDGETVVAGGASPTVRQWDVASGRIRPSFSGHPGPVHALLYTADGRRLLTASGNKALVWDAGEGKVLHRLEGHEAPINALACSPDDRHAYTGSGTALFQDNRPVYTDCVLRQWDLEMGREVQTLRTFAGPVQALAVSADSRIVYSAAGEPLLRRWTVTDRGLTPLEPWKASVSSALLVVVSPDGRTVVTVGLDYQVIQWDATTGKRVREWGLPEMVTALAIASDSRHLAIALSTGVVYVLRLAPPAGRG